MQERTADLLGYPGAEPRQRVERLMSDYFRHARTAHRSLSWARKGAPVPVGPNLGVSRDGIRFLDPIQAARNPGDLDRRVPGRDRRRHDGVRGSAVLHSAARRSLSRRRLLSGAARSGRAADAAQAAEGSVRPAVGDARLRAARARVPGVPGDLVAGGARLLPQVHGRRAHAAHDPEPRAASRRPRCRIDCASATSWARSIGPSCWSWRCCCTTSASGATTTTRSRACAWRSRPLERLQLDAEARETVLFLIRHHLRMSLVAFRRDTEDPEIVKDFSAFVGNEERLKMLTLMTLVDVEAVSPETLTPWKEELLWRLYVDTYNHLTQRYGDEVIERNQAGLERSAEAAARRSHRRRDHADSSRGCRSATSSSSRATSSTATCGWRATSIPTKCTCRSSAARPSVWSLAVATLDKPFLFSNICGVLSSFGMNIIRGHALTNPNGLVLDVFQFTDDERFLELNRDGQDQVLHVLEDVVSGRADVAARLRPREQGVLRAEGAPEVSARRPRRQPGVGPLHHSRHRGDATRSACCTGSAASFPSTAATSTSCSSPPRARRRSTCFTSPRVDRSSPRRSSRR